MTLSTLKLQLAAITIAAIILASGVSHAASSGGPANSNTPESPASSQDRKKNESGKPGESCEKQPAATTCQKPDSGPGFGLFPGGFAPKK